jgi:hypothetical protein
VDFRKIGGERRKGGWTDPSTSIVMTMVGVL